MGCQDQELLPGCPWSHAAGGEQESKIKDSQIHF